MTTGIKTSFKKGWAGELYLQYKDSNDTNFKLYCKWYCTILTKVIIAAKQAYYDNTITKSQNKMKTVWENVKGKTSNDELNKGMATIQDDDITANILNQFLIDLINYFYQQLIKLWILLKQIKMKLYQVQTL